jgi:hypothetical protein
VSRGVWAIKAGYPRTASTGGCYLPFQSAAMTGDVLANPMRLFFRSDGAARG